MEKCQFLKDKITVLGYEISNSTSLPSESETDYPMPFTGKSIQKFLRLTSYFSRFVPSYALVAKPLSDMLLKNVEFCISDEQILAFEQLKTALVNAPLLKLFNSKAITDVHTDARMHSYGAVLLQIDIEDQPSNIQLSI